MVFLVVNQIDLIPVPHEAIHDDGGWVIRLLDVYVIDCIHISVA